MSGDFLKEREGKKMAIRAISRKTARWNEDKNWAEKYERRQE